MSNPDYQRIRRILARRDPILRGLIRAVGPCTLSIDPDHFSVLARSIISQQISSRAAASIGKKVLLTLRARTFRPDAILAADDASLRAAGLSANKLRSLRDLAEKCASGDVPLRQLKHLDDEAVIESLIPVRGIGRWTAEMFLIFSLGRLDVFPVDDLGLKAGVQRHFGLAELPKKAVLHELGANWSPYRSIATWYLWRSSGPVPQSDAKKG